MFTVKETKNKTVDLKNLTITDDGLVDEDGVKVDLGFIVGTVFDKDSIINISFKETIKEEYDCGE